MVLACTLLWKSSPALSCHGGKEIGGRGGLFVLTNIAVSGSSSVLSQLLLSLLSEGSFPLAGVTAERSDL